MPIPSNAVAADTGGMVWVGRFNGEAGKINAEDGKMNSFLSHKCKDRQNAEILCCAPSLPKWHSIQRGQQIPSNAVKAGETHGEGALYVGKYQNEAGKINADSGKMGSFWAHHCGQSESA